MDLDQLYRDTAPWLRGFAYRICGDAAVAEDLLQETFLQVLETSRDGSIGPDQLLSSLVRIAIDALQARKAATYRGTWLPMPLQTDLGGGARPDDASARSDPAAGLDYELLCSLEGIPPKDRAAFVLSDIAGWKAPSIAEATAQPQAVVETSLTETARVLQEVRIDRGRQMDMEIAQAQLEGLASGLRSGALVFHREIAAVRIHLEVDHGGTCNAPQDQHCDPGAAAEILNQLVNQGSPDRQVEVIEANFRPAMIVDRGACPEGEAERMAILPGWGRDGLVDRVRLILSPSKLRGVSFDGLRPGLGEIV